jgi:hypothetical protein
LTDPSIGIGIGTWLCWIGWKKIKNIYNV